MNAKHPAESPLEPLAVSVKEAASLLGVGRSTVFELIREQRLASIKVGKRRLIPTEELEAFIHRAMGEVPWTRASSPDAARTSVLSPASTASGQGSQR